MRILLNNISNQPNINFRNKITTLNSAKKLTKAQIRKNQRNESILKMIAEGFSKAEIARELCITVETVRNFLKGKIIPDYAKEATDRIIERINKGETLELIMQEENLSKHIITSIAEKSGLKVITNFQKNIQEQNRLIETMILEGISTTDIAKELNISVTKVENIAKRSKLHKIYKEQRFSNIVKKINNNIPIEEILEEENISLYIFKRIKKEAIEKNLIIDKKQEQINRVIYSINAGETIEEIIEKEQISKQTVIRIASSANIKVISKARKKRDKRNNQILDLLLKGFTRTQIAEALDVELSMINRIAEKNKVFQKLIEQRSERIINKIKQGVPFSKIASDERIDESTVSRTAKKYGINMVNTPKYAEEQQKRNDLIIADIKNGINNSEIAKKFNVSYVTVLNIKKELGLTKKYNYLAKPQLFKFLEIKKQSQNITQLREIYRKFKLGERTPEIIQDMINLLEKLKINLEEFKSRFE